MIEWKRHKFLFPFLNSVGTLCLRIICRFKFFICLRSCFMESDGRRFRLIVRVLLDNCAMWLILLAFLTVNYVAESGSNRINGPYLCLLTGLEGRGLMGLCRMSPIVVIKSLSLNSSSVCLFSSATFFPSGFWIRILIAVGIFVSYGN